MSRDCCGIDIWFVQDTAVTGMFVVGQLVALFALVGGVECAQLGPVLRVLIVSIYLFIF